MAGFNRGQCDKKGVREHQWGGGGIPVRGGGREENCSMFRIDVVALKEAQRSDSTVRGRCEAAGRNCTYLKKKGENY
jgi:hypothetical protein